MCYDWFVTLEYEEVRRKPPLTAAWDCYTALQELQLGGKLPLQAEAPLAGLEDALVRIERVSRQGLETVPESVACEWCGQTVMPRSASGRRRRYCSGACRQAAHRAREADRPTGQ